MQCIIVKDPIFKKIKPSVKSLIFNDQFLEDVKRNIAIFDPVCILINTAQKSTSSLADIIHLWRKLEVPEEFQSFLEKRKKMAFNIYALCAYYIHPKYHDFAKNNFEEHETREVHTFFIENLQAEDLLSLTLFKEKRGVFRKLFEKNCGDGFVFWKFAKVYYSALASLALKLLQIPSSSAQIERVFSNWSFVHSPLRNRLSFEKSKKLLHVYYTHKIKDSNKSEDY